jgi:putative ABC transport system permease protein
VNLLLTRSLAREKDIAIRVSLGASRWELMRHILAETVLLSLIGGAFGLLFANWGVAGISSLIHIQLPPWMTISVDRPVLFFTLGISIFAGILSGLMPALHATRPNMNELLKEGTRGSSFGSQKQALRRALVTAEIALALILLIGAGLMVRTFLQLQNTELGFNPQNILTIRIALPWKKYETLDQTEPFTTQLLEHLKALPGVTDAVVTSNLPLSGEAEEGKITFTLEGQSWDQQQKNPYINDISISPGYFHLMKIPLLQGRLLEESDQANSPRVAIVSRHFAERIWPGQNPLGKRLKAGSPDSEAQWTTIIGVVGNVKHENVTGNEGLDLYVSYRQVTTSNVYVLLKGRMNPVGLAEEATKTVWRLDADQSTFDVQTMEQRIAGILWQRRISGILVILFAILAVVLAGIGIYGVMSYSISQRTREIGIRIALGARGKDVREMVLREVLHLFVLGSAIGLPGAIVLSWLMSSLFYKVSPLDPPTYVSVPILLLLVAVTAGGLPAYRASRIDPIDALRYE